MSHCIDKGYAEFWVCLNMAQYTSIMPEYALISLNMPNHDWKLLNVSEYAWKCLNKLFWLSQGFQYTSSSYIFDRVMNIPQVLSMPGFWIRRALVIITLLFSSKHLWRLVSWTFYIFKHNIYNKIMNWFNKVMSYHNY